MKNNRNLSIIILLLPAILLWQAAFAKEAPPVSGGFNPERLKAAEGEIVELSLEFTSEINAAEWKLNMELPDGLVILEGMKKNHDDVLEPGRKYAFHYKLKMLTAGEKRIWAYLHYSDAQRTGITLSAAFLAIINEDLKKEDSEIKSDKKGRSLRVIKIPSTK